VNRRHEPRRAPVEAADATLAARLRQAGLAQSWNEARRLCAAGRVRVDGCVVTDPVHRPPPASRIELGAAAPAPREASGFDLVYEDAAVVVVNKAAGLSTVPFESGEQGTLVQRVADALHRRERAQCKRQGRPPPARSPYLGVVQRLDKDTSGILVFARSLASQRALGQQFRVHSVERRYLAVVAGELLQGTSVRAMLVRDRGDGRRGVGQGPGAREAVTHVEVLERFDGATLVGCRLETGRTHQVRIHLAHLGHPLLGDEVYGPPEPRLPPVLRGDPGRVTRHLLHAEVLGFEHPLRGGPLRFVQPPPDDFQAVLEALRVAPR
jgi:23S rRNA pseudouridine1911/1915/1917 synthase